MENSSGLGIGPSGLRSAKKHLEGEKTAAEESGDDSGENSTDQERSSEQGASEENAAEENSSEENASEGSASEQPVPDPDEVAGRGGQMVVKSQSAGHQEAQIQCGATSCVFNRDHNCEAGEVHISFNPNKGMRSAATQCDTYQTAPVSDEE